jgi:hypothetical protein
LSENVWTVRNFRDILVNVFSHIVVGIDDHLVDTRQMRAKVVRPWPFLDWILDATLPQATYITSSGNRGVGMNTFLVPIKIVLGAEAFFPSRAFWYVTMKRLVMPQPMLSARR